jgi:hypothetical protein
MATRRVELVGMDVSRWVTSIPVIVPATGDYGQITFTELPRIVGRDVRSFWDQQTQQSPFFGAPHLTDYPVRVLIGTQPVYAGHVKGITSDGYSATITLQGALQATLESGCVYASPTGGTSTPSSMAREILDLYKIPYDPASFAASHAFYASNSIYCAITQPLPNNTVQAVLEAIVQTGCARMYSVNGIVYFDAYQVRTSLPMFTFTDRRPSRLTLWKRPQVTALEKDRMEGYTVQWVGSPDATFNSTKKAIRTLSGKSDAIVQINSLQAADKLGQLWYSYLNTPQNSVTIGVPAAIGKDLRLGYPIGIDYTRYEASITVDITKIDPGNPLITMVTGLTR